MLTQTQKCAMILEKLLYKKKYIKPFIDNLVGQYSMDNAVFFSDYEGTNFLIILCIKNQLLEIEKVNNNINFFKLNINEENFAQWGNYKDKILKMKEQAIASRSRHVILLMAENIRHISNQANLSFKQTKEIFSFLLNGNQAFFINNTINITEDMGHSWID
jgi:hypothetical protein